MIGDGTISQYHIAISLDAKTDLLYADYISDLITTLFGYEPKKYFRKNSRSVDVVVHRVGVVEFLQECGLPQGHKIAQGIDIPTWVKENPLYYRACLRGLIDTDGSLFEHSYVNNGKRYSYSKIGFTSASPALIQSVQLLLRQEGFYARITASGREVRIEK